MDAVLSQPLTISRSLREVLQFDRFIAVGANSGGDQVRAWLLGQSKKVIAFADLSPKLQGTRRAGLEVLSPVDAVMLMDRRTAFMIGTVKQQEAAELLIGTLGVDPLRVFPFVNPMFAAHFREGVQNRIVPHQARIRSLLSDEESRAYFDRVTKFYRTLDSRYLTPQPKRIGQYGYDAPGANPKPGAAIVDCGAFTGDTFADFIGATQRDCKIFAFEAFPPNFEKLLDNIARDKLQNIVEPRQLAVGREKGTIRISGDDSIADGGARVGTSVISRDHVVPSDTLDDLFLRHSSTRIDYLKVDIEGADLDALIGGREMLRTFRPIVAVAAYHKPEHLFEIVDVLRETLAPCELYAAHDPNWVFHIHYIAVPGERARTHS